MYNFLFKCLYWMFASICAVVVTILTIVLIPVRIVLDIFRRDSIREGIKTAIVAYLDYFRLIIKNYKEMEL